MPTRIALLAFGEVPRLLTGTLKTINDRGTILIGVREASLPFSFLNKGRQPVGLSVDLCHGIAQDVASALNVDLLEPDAPAGSVPMSRFMESQKTVGALLAPRKVFV